MAMLFLLSEVIITLVSMSGMTFVSVWSNTASECCMELTNILICNFQNEAPYILL